MYVSFIGLGKLGLPVSVAMALKGNQVLGYDLSPILQKEISQGKTSLYEPFLCEQLNKVLRDGSYRVADSLDEIIEHGVIVFVAVQTPSKEDGSFETSYLRTAINDLKKHLVDAYDYKVVAIISTVLPTTVRMEIYPILQSLIPEKVGLIYNPSFIAMGTVIMDFLDPEFVLIGESDEKSGKVMDSFYSSIMPPNTPILHMTWEEAEITKMTYNTFIGLKIITANTIMEICERIPHANIDIISNALSKANKRIVGPKYLQGGMGDGGPCHPRDQDALSWFAHKIDLSVDPFGFVMEARWKQTEYLANIVINYQRKTKLPIIILGKRYKPETNLTDYSPSLLLSRILENKGIQHAIYDPLIDGDNDNLWHPSVFVVTLQDEKFQNFPYPKGSIVIDVWRFLKNQNGLTYHRLGGGFP